MIPIYSTSVYCILVFVQPPEVARDSILENGPGSNHRRAGLGVFGIWGKGFFFFDSPTHPLLLRSRSRRRRNHSSSSFTLLLRNSNTVNFPIGNGYTYQSTYYCNSSTGGRFQSSSGRSAESRLHEPSLPYSLRGDSPRSSQFVHFIFLLILF